MIRRQAVIVVAWMLVVLGAGLLASLLVSQHQANRNQSFIHQMLLNDGKLIEHELIGRLDIYTYRLRSIRGAIYMLQLPTSPVICWRASAVSATARRSFPEPGASASYAASRPRMKLRFSVGPGRTACRTSAFANSPPTPASAT